MKYKEFIDWCNHRACDGCWGSYEAIFCSDIIGQIQRTPFWKRERKWQELNNKFSIENNIIIPINNKMIEIYGKVL